MTLIKYYFLVLCSLATLIFSGNSYSTCTFFSGRVDDEGTAPIINLTVDPNAPLNSVLGTTYISLNGMSVFDCTSSYIPIYDSPLPIISPGIYRSGVSGIGLKFKRQANSIPYTGVIEQSLVPNYWGASIQIELIKVGPITQGGQVIADRTTIVRKIAPSHGNVVLHTAVARVGFTATLAAKPTCSVTSTSISVNLGEVSMSNFDAEGRSPKIPLSIDLTCSGSTNGGRTGIYVTLTDQTQPGNRSEQLNLSPDSTATGVALEVTNRLGLVSFGADSTTIGNPGQWNQGMTGNGNYSIPLSVNYLKVNSQPTPGSANAVATFTISYQ